MTAAEIAEMYRRIEIARAALHDYRPPQKRQCQFCNGTGIDGDVGDDGRVIDVPCGCRAASA